MGIAILNILTAKVAILPKEYIKEKRREKMKRMSTKTRG